MNDTANKAGLKKIIAIINVLIELVNQDKSNSVQLRKLDYDEFNGTTFDNSQEVISMNAVVSGATLKFNTTEQ